MNRIKKTIICLVLPMILTTKAFSADLNGTLVKLGMLDKITGRFSSNEVEVGAVLKFGTLDIVAKACTHKPPEEAPESTAYLEITEKKPSHDAESIFKGWMFSSTQTISLDNSVYDVWLLGCRSLENSAVLDGSEEVEQTLDGKVEEINEEEGTSFFDTIRSGVKGGIKALLEDSKDESEIKADEEGASEEEDAKAEADASSAGTGYQSLSGEKEKVETTKPEVKTTPKVEVKPEVKPEVKTTPKVEADTLKITPTVTRNIAPKTDARPKQNSKDLEEANQIKQDFKAELDLYEKEQDKKTLPKITEKAEPKAEPKVEVATPKVTKKVEVKPEVEAKIAPKPAPKPAPLAPKFNAPKPALKEDVGVSDKEVEADLESLLDKELGGE